MITYDGAFESMLMFATELRELPIDPILVELVGSCAIQGASSNDADFLVYSKNNAHEISNYLLGSGWVEQEGNSEYGGGDFRSFRLGDYNCLLVWDERVYTGWMVSVEICKHINTKTRDQRVAIHRIIMDGQLAANTVPFDQLIVV